MTTILGVSTSSFGLRRSSTHESSRDAPASLSTLSPARSNTHHLHPTTNNTSSSNGMFPSPVPPNSASLLFPINPAFDDAAPQGGILLNKRRPSDTPEYVSSGGSGGQAGWVDEPVSVNLGTIGSSGTVGTGWVDGLPSPGREGLTRLPMSPTLTTDGKTLDSGGTPHVRPSGLEGVPASGQVGSASTTAPRIDFESSSTSPLTATPSATTRPGHTRIPSSTKIRFAPLPTPNRKRSLSTGRIVTKAKLEPDGTRTMERFSRRGDTGDDSWVSDENEGGKSGQGSAVQDDEDEDSEAEEEDTGKTSSWKTMGMSKKRTSSITSSSYTYTKKLFKPFSSSSSSGGGEDKTTEESSSLTFGSPLRKTLSTGGMMGSSPFRSSGEQDRRRSFLSTGSLMGNSKGDSSSTKRSHLRNGSSSNPEKPDFSSLSSSLGYKAETEFAPSAASMPKTDRRPVKMLNGRVYGAEKAGGKGAASAEPEFSEWGGLMGARGGGMGSNQPIASTTNDVKSAGSTTSTDELVVKKSGFLDDQDDGSGMGWVKRRREQRERERRASEQAPPAMRPPEDPTTHLTSSTDSPRPLIGSVPSVRVTPPHWPETFSPDESERSLGEYISARSTEATIMEETSVPGTPGGESRSESPAVGGAGAGAGAGAGGAVKVPLSSSRQEREWTGSRGRGRDGSAIEDESESDSGEVDEEDGDEDDEEEEEDDDEGDRGDFESDSEDEVELDMEGLGQSARSTSSAAGVEVMVRHHD